MTMSGWRVGSPPLGTEDDDLDRVAIAFNERFRALPAAERGPVRDRFVVFALPFAGRLARRYRQRGEPLEDLEQVARLGLVKAVDRYDPARGSFTAYAVSTIRGEIKRHFRDRAWAMGVPRRLRDLRVDVGRAESALISELGRRPSEGELAGRLDIDAAEVREVMAAAGAYRPGSLSSPVGDGTLTAADVIGELDEGVESAVDRVCLANLLEHVPARERRILALRFSGNKTQAEIAQWLGMSQMHVSRLLSRTLEWLREAMMADTPRSWPAAGADHRLAIEVRRRGSLVELGVSGEVDRDTADQLRRALVNAASMPGTDRIEIDLHGVPLVDAAGLTALERGADAAPPGVALRVTGAQAYVRRALAFSVLGRHTDLPGPGGRPD
jgi:RNA polymerase sigma-B factor